MKKWTDLSDEEKEKAVNAALNSLLRDIIESGFLTNENSELGRRINRALEESERKQTPWFAHEYIMDTCREDLTNMAKENAIEALYPEPGETILYI